MRFQKKCTILRESSNKKLRLFVSMREIGLKNDATMNVGPEVAAGLVNKLACFLLRFHALVGISGKEGMRIGNGGWD